MKLAVGDLFRKPVLDFENDDELTVYKVNLENERYFMLSDHYVVKSYEFIRKKALETMFYLYSLDIKSEEDDIKSEEDDEESDVINNLALAPYLGMNYFDRFMSKSKGSNTSTPEYYAMCCFFLGRQMISEDFFVQQYVNQHKLNIDQERLSKTQLEILSILDFKLRPVTVLSFVDYFTSPLEKEDDRRHLVREVAIQAQSEFALLKFKPSVIAASLVLAVYEDLEIDSIGLNIKKEEIESCLEIIKRVLVKYCASKGEDAFKLIWLDQDINFSRVPSCLSMVRVNTMHRSKEEILFKFQDVKLHRSNVQESRWQESTVGPLFLLKDTERNMVRIVVRRSIDNMVFANQWVPPRLSLKHHVLSCAWEVSDFTFGESKNEKFCVLFSSTKDCQQFVSILKTLCKN